MRVTRTSQFTGIEHTRDLALSPVEYDAILAGSKPIQQLAPHLTADEREFLLTGVTPEEWEAFLGPEPTE